MTESEERAAFARIRDAGIELLSTRDHSGVVILTLETLLKLASSPPVPQQLAKLKSALYDISSGDFDATDDKVRALMCVIQELHLDQRLRDVKTNQEIDAMVREMKQPSDEQIIEARQHTRSKSTEPWADTIAFARAVLALHAEPVEKMKGETVNPPAASSDLPPAPK